MKAALVMMVIAGVAQASLWFVIGSVNPNLVLIALVAVAGMVEHFWQALLLASIGAALIQGTPGELLQTIGVMIAASVIWLLYHRLPWQPLMNSMIAIIVGTLALYATIDSAFIITSPKILIEEIAISIIGTLLFYGIKAQY